jgi:hypothetical protein
MKVNALVGSPMLKLLHVETAAAKTEAVFVLETALGPIGVPGVSAMVKVHAQVAMPKAKHKHVEIAAPKRGHDSALKPVHGTHGPIGVNALARVNAHPWELKPKAAAIAAHKHVHVMEPAHGQAGVYALMKGPALLEKLRTSLVVHAVHKPEPVATIANGLSGVNAPQAVFVHPMRLKQKQRSAEIAGLVVAQEPALTRVVGATGLTGVTVQEPDSVKPASRS